MSMVDEEYSAHAPVWAQVRTVDDLGWEPMEDTMFSSRNGKLVEGWRELYRSDNEHTLHLHQDSYHTITNTQLYSLRDALLENGAQVDALSEVNGGKKVYCVMHLDEPLVVEGDRTLTFPYFIIINTFDGSGSLQVLPLMGRLACWNMIPAATSMAKKNDLHIKFKHTASASIKVEEARAVLKDVRKLSAGWQSAMNDMVNMKVDEMDTKWFITKFIPLPDNPESISDRQANSIINNRNLLEWTIKNSKTLDGVRDTSYGLYQAGIEYLDHMRGRRGGTDGLVTRTILKVDPGKYRAYKLALDAANPAVS